MSEGFICLSTNQSKSVLGGPGGSGGVTGGVGGTTTGVGEGGLGVGFGGTGGGEGVVLSLIIAPVLFKM